MVTMPFLDQRGSLQLPMLFALVLVGLTGLGIWGVQRGWRHLMETQLRLDRCAGEAALELRDHVSRTESLNLKMREIRAASLAGDAVAGGAAAAAARAALVAAAGLQDTGIARWELRRASWLARHGCGERGDGALPLPAPAWRRPPPDAIGPRPLEWEPERPGELRVQVEHAPRAAAALVSSVNGGNHVLLENVRWTARWAPPRRGSPIPGRVAQPKWTGFR